MIALRNIQTAYENPDLLLEHSNRNIAVDVSARTRLITLRDADLEYKGVKVSVPGTSYLISYKELEKIVNERIGVTIGEVNAINHLLTIAAHNNSLSVESYLRTAALPEEQEHVDEWINSGGLEALICFSEIQRCRQPNWKGLVVLKSVDPISLQKNYQQKGKNKYKNKLAKVSLPLEVQAQEGEFTFYSENGVKISDGDDNVGICNEGILEFENLNLYVLDECRINSQALQNPQRPSRLSAFLEYWQNLTGQRQRSTKEHNIGYEIMMQIAFHGILKDKRAEY